MPQRNTLLFFEIVVCPFMADLSLFHFSTAALAGCDQENTTKGGRNTIYGTTSFAKELLDDGGPNRVISCRMFPPFMK